MILHPFFLASLAGVLLCLAPCHAQSQSPAEDAHPPAPLGSNEGDSPPEADASVEPSPASDERVEPTHEAGPDELTTNPSPAALDEDSDESPPGDPWGDALETAKDMFSFRTLLQVRYATTFAAGSKSDRESYVVREDYLAQRGDGWSINRAFFGVKAKPNKYVDARVVADFSELFDDDPEDALKRAYVRLRPLPKHLELSVGLFKKAFSSLEIDPSRKREVTDRGESNGLIKDLDYAGRDLGLQIMGAPLPKAKRLRIYLGAFQGHAKDEHDLPLGMYTARVETRPGKGLRFGAGISDHFRKYTYDRPFSTSDRDALPNPPDLLYPNQKRWGAGRLYAADARYKKHGLNVRAEAMYGDRVDIDERYGARTFWAAWGLVSYRIRLSSVKLIPAVRFEWFDGDLQHDHGRRRLATVALTAVFLERLRFLLDVSQLDVEPNSPRLNQPKPLQQDPFMDLDRTRVTAQLQFDM